MGTIDYVSPEQIRGEDVDGRADVYSLGCLLYECLTGRQPFKRGNDAAILYAHLEDEPPATDTAADPVLTRALAKSPDERYQTCGELAEAARQALGVAAPRRSRFPLAIAILVVAAGVASFLSVYLLRGSGAAPGPHGVLVRIDPKNNKLAGQVTVGAEPTGVAVAGNRVWVTTFGDSGVWRVDARSLSAVRIGAPGRPIGVAATGTTAYVADNLAGNFGDPGNVARVQAASDVVSDIVPTGGAFAVAGSRDGVWVARPGGAVLIGNVSTFAGKIARKVAIPDGMSWTFTGIGVGASGVWVLGDALGRRLWRIDPATGRVVASVRLPFAPASVAAGDGSVWVTAQLDDEVVRVDPRTNRIVVRIPVGREPLDVAVGDGAVWVANTIDDTVSRIDPATNHVVATIRLGWSPKVIAAGAGAVWVGADAR